MRVYFDFARGMVSFGEEVPSCPELLGSSLCVFGGGCSLWLGLVPALVRTSDGEESGIVLV